MHQCDPNATDRDFLMMCFASTSHSITSSDKTHHNSPTTFPLQLRQDDILDVITHDSHLFTGSILDTTQFQPFP